MGGTPKQTTTKTEPWDEQKPYLIETMKEAQKLYKDPSSPQYFQGNTLADLNAQQKTAMNQMYQQGIGGTGVVNAASNAATQIAGGQYNPALGMFTQQANANNPYLAQIAHAGTGTNSQANSTVSSIMNSYNPALDMTQGVNPYAAQNTNLASFQTKTTDGLGDFNNIYNQAQSNTSSNPNAAAMGTLGEINQSTGYNPFIGQGAMEAEGLTGSTARGDYLNSNPYLDATFNKAADAAVSKYKTSVLPGLDSNSAQAGRYGSGAWAAQRNASASALQQNLMNMATDVYGGNYERERGLQEAAQGRLGDQTLARQSQQIGALQNQQADRAKAASQLNDAAFRSGDATRQNQNIALNALGERTRAQQTDIARQLQASGMLSDVLGQGTDRALSQAQQWGDQYAQNNAQRLGAAGQAYDQLNTVNANEIQRAGMGSDAYQNLLNYRQNATQGLGDVFNKNTQNRLQAAQLAPELQRAQYADLDAAFNVGSAYQDNDQARINAEIDKWNYNQNLDQMKLMNYINAVNGNYGSSTAQTGLGKTGGIGAGIGGALSGAGAGAAFGPWGAAAGAGLGLLGGLLG